MSVNRKSLLVLFIALLIVPFLSSVQAVAADFPIMVDGPSLSQSGFLDGVVSGDKISFSVEKDRSYCCSILSSDLSDDARFANSVKDLGQFTFPRTAFNGNRAPVIPVAGDHPAPAQARFCFAPSNNSVLAFPLEFDDPPQGKVRAWCEETTLVGSYNLVAADFAYLEVSTAHSQSDLEDIWVRATSSAPQRDIIGELDLGRGPSRFDRPIHEFVPAATFGNVYLTHNGPPNSVFGSVAQYEVRTVLPFTFSIVSKDPLRPRVP